MKKHELLVPAGNMDCLHEAVLNGCDAVYLACKNFGARKFANNFSNEEIISAIKYCHLYGVRVYVTMNTLVKNNEVSAFIEQAKFLHENGVDALIVQDFGMICLLRDKFPNLEIHASTQANISSREVCKLYKKLGVKRVVFAREIGIDEIDSIDVDIEKEAFIHGALCISYSGCCLMSSMLGGRSGNRGECAGCCRMPFTLEKDGEVLASNKYLLSTKELNSTYNIKRLLDSSIDSFKIEGRMKSPLYVGFITNLYRRLIDGVDVDLDLEIDKLKTIFNRQFTKGRLFYEDDKNLMNIDSPNHIGLNIGKVLDFNKDKIKLKINSKYKLNQYDAIRFMNQDKGFIVNFLYDEKMKLTNSSSGICYVDNKVGLTKIDVVSKTQDYLLQDEVFKNSVRKIPVRFFVEAKLNNNLVITITDGINKISLSGSIVQNSINSPMSRDGIIKQLSKLGDTPFNCNDYIVDMDDNIFIQIRELNELRRELVNKLIECRENAKIDVIEEKVAFNYNHDFDNKRTISCFVYNEEQLMKCLKLKIDKIFVVCLDLYNKYKNIDNIFYVNPRCSFDIKEDINVRNVISDYIDFNSYNCLFIGSYGLNVTNIYTAYYLNKIGISSVMLSVELTEDEIIKFIDFYNEKFGYFNFNVLTYGRVENMIIKGNILNIDKGINNNYQLIDFKNRKFPVYYDGVNTHIMNYELKIFENKTLINNCNIVIDLFLENNIEKVVNMYIDRKIRCVKKDISVLEYNYRSDTMNKENSRSKLHNYVLLFLLFGVCMWLVVYLCQLYKVNEEEKRKIPIISGYLSEIYQEDLEHYILDNPTTVIYMCTSNNDTCRTFERDFKKLLKKKDYQNQVVYLNLTDIDQDSFVEEFNNKYNYKIKLTTEYPAFILFDDSKIRGVLQGTESDKLTITKVRQFLELK